MPLTSRHRFALLLAALVCMACFSMSGVALAAHTTRTDCESCHSAPQGHYPGACVLCHPVPGQDFRLGHYSHTGTETSCAQCHESKRPAGHYPGDCIQCHSKSAATLVWTGASYTHTGNETSCAQCHESKRPTGHYTGDCVRCHAASATSLVWTGAIYAHTGTESTCLPCHEKDRPAVHSSADCVGCHKSGASWTSIPHLATEVETDSCAMCHRTHTSFADGKWAAYGVGREVAAEGNALLVGEPKGMGDVGLCLTCHGVGALGSGEDVGTAFSKESTHSLMPTKSPYGPKDKQCSSCHDSHGTEKRADGSIYPGLLRSRGETGSVMTGDEYCSTCHWQARPNNRWDGESTFRQTKHYTALPDPASGTGIRCENCHTAHGSSNPPLIREKLLAPAVATSATIDANDRTLCLACHGDAKAPWPGTTGYQASAHGASTAMTAILGEWPAKYPAARQSRKVGECANCHAPMGRSDGSGGVVASLLDEQGADLCYRCHKPGGSATADLASLAPVSATNEPDVVTVWSPDSRAAQYAGIGVWSRETTVAGAPLVGPRDFTMGGAAGSAATGDINGDGRDEIVVARKGTPRLSVFSVDPTRGLRRVDYDIDAPADLVAIAKVLPDSTLPEVAVVDHATGTLRLYRFASSAFQLLSPTYAVGSDANGIAAGDVTGSALADLVVTSGSENALRILTENGAALQVSAPAGTGPAPMGPSVGHALPGGAKAQIAVANSGVANGTAGLSILDGSGATVLTRDVTPAALKPVGTLIADVLPGPGVAGAETFVLMDDGPGSDAYVDVFTQVEGGGISTAPQWVTLGKDRHPTDLTAADVDGDGAKELAVVNSGLFGSAGADPGVAILKSDATGTKIDAGSLVFKPAGGRQLAGGMPSVLVADLGMLGASRHPMDLDLSKHTPTEAATTGSGGAVRLPTHVTCSDCHNSHSATATATATRMPGELLGTWGVATTNNAIGDVGLTELRGVSYEYQLCFKCHSPWSDNGVSRDLAQEFNPLNPSVHAVEATASASSVPSSTFMPGWSSTSILTCSDCHGNSGADQARGPHRSDAAPLLVAPLAGTAASDSGDLCFKCHKPGVYATGAEDAGTTRSNFGNGTTALHGTHVSGQGLACSACHVSHGSATKPHLMRSDIGYNAGTSGGGSCDGSCHASDPKPYTGP